MTTRFTLGIEEEFQMVDRRTGQLSPSIQTIMAKGSSALGERIKPEQHASMVELVSPVLPDIVTARSTMGTLRAQLAQLLAEEGLALISAGTHPSARWQEEPISPYERYWRLEEEYQDATRCNLAFGLHIHVGIENRELALALTNQLRSWLPHLLALSTNSPFWAGRFTGIKSFRSVVWKTTWRSGIPEAFSSWQELDASVQTLIQMGCIEDGKQLWWDIRPHPFFQTIEFRICDMPATFDEMLALAALCQALVAKLSWLYTRGLRTPVLSARFIEENKWRAVRRGLDAEALDFVRMRRLSMRQAIGELLDFVDEVVDDLGSRREMDCLRARLEDPRGTGADRQIALYHQTHSLPAVTRWLMQQTVQGIPQIALENPEVARSAGVTHVLAPLSPIGKTR
jgi:glutamate---cysteine ligase / carboxylate-amine ligase